MKDLTAVLHEWNPKPLPNGQIRMMCPFRENHRGAKAAVTGLGESSFFASPDINAYHCFSCRAKGKLTRLLQSDFGLSLYEAIDYVQLIPVERINKKFELDFMWRIEAPRVFTRKGYSSELLEDYQVGIRDDGSIIIPLYLHSELKGAQIRKYGKERHIYYTDGFRKELFVYNYQKGLKEVVIVEGPSDAWRLIQYGYKNVFALMGVDMSPDQFKLFFENIPVWNLALDCDSPGVAGMHKIYEEHKYDAQINFIDYGYKDPGECTRKAWYYAMKHPKNYAEFSYATKN